MLALMPRRYREFDTTSRLPPRLWESCVSCCSVSRESWWSMLGTNQTHPSRIWLMMSHTCELHGGSFSWNRLASLAGTLPAGGSFCSVKRNQNPLRAFPPKDLPGVRGWNCVKTMVGPSPLLWPLLLPPHQANLGNWPYGWVVSMPGPTLEKRRCRRREPGIRALGTAAHQGKALGVEEHANIEVSAAHRDW